MIVISGVLAIVALALLIAGLASTGLTLVYISIAVSLVSAVFLGVGAYQRRGEEAVTPSAAPEPGFVGAGDELTRVVSPVGVPAEASVEFSEAASASDGDGAGPNVLVVPGRPRYHVSGCRYLVGKDAEERSVADARNEGYTACGICRPDENLPAARPAEEPTAALVPVGGGADGDEPGDTEPAAPVGRSAATRGASKTTAKKTAAKKTAKTAAASSAKTTAKSTTKKTAAKSTTATTGKTAAKKTSPAGKKTAASAATVVVIPDRDKFHTADCRFVKGVRGTAKLPKAQARQQGYQACGVCKP
ncbi:MAG: hypothetical protein ACJ735_02830 [Actinomycetes bacterium]